MQYKTSKVNDNLLPEGVERLYQGHIIKGETVTASELSQRVSKRIKFDNTIVTNVLAALAAEIDDAVRAGERPVLDGVFSTRFTVNGAFDSEDDIWDVTRNSLGIAFVTQDPLKSTVADIVPTNVLSQVVVQLLGSEDATTCEQNCLTVGHTLLCQGKNLKLVTERADEGLFLIKGSTGTSYKATVTDSTAATVDATFPTDMPAGEDYTLVIRGRGGNGLNRSLVSDSISGFIVKASA